MKEQKQTCARLRRSKNNKNRKIIQNPKNKPKRAQMKTKHGEIAKETQKIKKTPK